MKITIMKSTLNYLSFCCIWPNLGEEFESRKYYLTKFIFVLILATPLLVLSFLHLINNALKEENKDLIEDLVMITAQIGVIYFIILFVVYQTDLAKIFLQLSDFDEFDKPPHFDKRNRELENISKLFNKLILIAASCMCMWPALYTKECEKSNEVKIYKDVCGLVSAAWLPFDFSRFPRKYIVYAWQCYCCLFTFRAAAMISIAMMENMEHLIIRIQHLKILIHDIVGDVDPQSRHIRFGKWVRYHVEVLSIGERMNTSYKNGLFVHVICTGILFGCIGHAFMTKTSLSVLPLFCGWFASLVVVCIGGQRLMDETTSVGPEIYNTKWYKTDVALQKKLIPAIIISRKPILIYAGPFTYVSHVIVLKILQTAFSYINLLSATS